MTRATVVEVASHSTPGKAYRVWVGADGPLFCECPSHKFVRDGIRRPCKHMRAMAESADLPLAQALAYDRPGMPATVKPQDSRFRFIEVQEQNEAGAWSSVLDLARFTNLEV